MLLAHALELLVDLLRGLDSVRGVRLGAIGRCGPVGWSWSGCRSDGWNVGGRCGLGLIGLGGRSFLGLWPVIEGRGVWIWRRWSALTRGEDELGRCVAVAMHDEHVAAGAVE